jgi:regulator of cell morphogenesis and NO signaling
MLIQKDMKLANVIHHDHNLIPVINRFGIQLGFGEKTIEELCKEYAVNVDFFLVILNAYHDHQYFPRKQLQSFPASMLIDYLNRSHNDYLEKKIPEIEQLIDKLNQEDGLDTETFLLLKNFFREYKIELTNHISKEEERVYPYVKKLESAISKGAASENLLSEMEEYSITDYEDEHDDVEEKLYDLKNILIKYVPPALQGNNTFKILQELFTLETDLNDHSRIEDLILVPKVEAMEYMLKSMSA